MKTIVTGALQATEEELNALAALGLEITIHPDERAPVASPEQYEAAICNGLFLYNDIAAFQNLRYIQLTSAGFDRVPMDYVWAHGIEIHNAAGVYAAPMAEWTLMRLLELYKNAAALFEDRGWVKDRTWRELGGKTACIVGFGAYGQETAKRLRAFGVRVLAVNRTKKESPYIDEYYPLDRLDAALAQAEIVILAVALTEETKFLMNAARFAAMKPGAVFLNATRGGLVDEAALLDALDGDRLSGAALDVFETEPLPEDSPLRGRKDLLISPHNSFVGEGNRERLMEIVSENYRIWRN